MATKKEVNRVLSETEELLEALDEKSKKKKAVKKKKAIKKKKVVKKKPVKRKKVVKKKVVKKKKTTTKKITKKSTGSKKTVNVKPIKKNVPKKSIKRKKAVKKRPAKKRTTEEKNKFSRIEKAFFEKEKIPKERIKDSDRVKAMFCYIPVIGWIIALLIYVIERESHYVQYHAVQGILLAIIIFIFSLIPYIESVASPLGVLGSIYMMVMAYRRKYSELPLIGWIAKKFM